MYRLVVNQDDPDSIATSGNLEESYRMEIEELIKKRSLAKANKDFLLADKIRTDLRNIGIELIDKPKGITEWKQLAD